MAHAKMLAAQGIISAADASKITAGLAAILDDFYRGVFELKPELEDVHMNVEARLAEKIGPLAGRLHTARSRNDQVATDLRMYVKHSHAAAIASLGRIMSALLDLAEANRDVVMPGYTHLQRAQPVLFRAPPAGVRRDVLARCPALFIRP